MSQSQPLNTEISVFRRVRVQRDMDRHASVKGMRTFGDQRVVVPSEEIRVLPAAGAGDIGYDSTFKTDAWRYGHPIVRYERAVTTPAEMYAADTGSTLAIPKRLGDNTRDIFIEKNAANKTDDIQQDARDVK